MISKNKIKYNIKKKKIEKETGSRNFFFMWELRSKKVQ